MLAELYDGLELRKSLQKLFEKHEIIFVVVYTSGSRFRVMCACCAMQYNVLEAPALSGIILMPVSSYLFAGRMNDT